MASLSDVLCSGPDPIGFSADETTDAEVDGLVGIAVAIGVIVWLVIAFVMALGAGWRRMVGGDGAFDESAP